MNIIKEKMPVPELLAGLAEECSELAQAALKLRRVFDKTNPTPMDEETAKDRFFKEVADVQLYLKMIDIPWNYIKEIAVEKGKRWTNRLKGTER
jgi:NTP pyrophosphatase (non-canonical NTP hydrolase)